MGLFNLFKQKNKPASTIPAPVPTSSKNISNVLTVKVVGTEYRDQSELLSLGNLNSDYSLDKRSLIKKFPDGEAVYEYTFPIYQATFEFEPTNEYDPNAIKVLINGIHVGYVKRGSCSRVRNLINQNRILDITAKISGGNFKSLYCSCGIEEKPTLSDYELDKDSRKLYITLSLTLAEK